MKCLVFSGALVAIVSLASLSGLYYAAKVYDHPLEFRPQRPLASAVVNETHPPLYEELDFLELSLPQHNASLPNPEGGTGRYFYPANRLWGVGFNNVFQEHLLLAHLAYMANRSFVFTPYTWNWNLSEPYALNGETVVPSRIPWHAFLKGPAFGDPFPPGDPAPRAVRSEYWETVCRWPKVVDSSSVAFGLGRDQNIATVMDAWVKKLNSLSSRCVKVYDRSPHIFKVEAFVNHRIIEVFEPLMESPIITQLRWSPLVDSAVQDNLHALIPFTQPSSFSPDDKKSSLSGLLVVHLRLGDFDVHCYRIHKQSMHTQGWFELPGIPDKFDPPSEEEWEARHDYYYKSCSPSFYQIINKLQEIRESEQGKGLRPIYLMSNGSPDYLHGLKSVLMDNVGWEFVMSSRDMSYNAPQQYISHAVDMAIAQRAQVFLGNGFSSLSSNVVLLRFANGMPAESNRMF